VSALPAAASNGQVPASAPPPRSICLDAQGAQSHDHHDRGIARYIVEHTRALHTAGGDALHSVLLNPTLPLPGSLDWLLGEGRLGWSTNDRRVVRRPTSRPALYHVMSPFELHQTPDALWPGWARSPAVRTVVTLYDTIPLVFPEHYLRDPVIAARYQARADLVRSADRVLAISEVTAADAIGRLGVDEDRVSVIHAGATAKFADMHRSVEAAWRALDQGLGRIEPGFVLYVAGFEFRKNLERVVAAYGLMSPEARAAHQLVIACRMTESEQLQMHEWARAAGIEEGRVVLTGYVSDEELGALYRTCELLLFASIYEGSGLPILEAMSCGAPVVASATSTSPEILGDVRGTFDPYDPAAIASVVEDTLGSPDTLADLTERSRERVGRYTWERVAGETLTAYREVLARSGRGPGRTRRARPRLALVSPWPPQRSGVADYSYRLATALGEHADVDIVVGEPLDHFAPPLERGVTLAQQETFRALEAVREPDRVLYCMGNSSFHGHVFELLRQRPGAVIAHDVRLTGFYGWFAGREHPLDPGGRLAERIEALYGARMPRDVRSGGAPTWQRQAALGIFMTREVQEYAEELFVHSRHARDVLELDRGVLDRQTPVTVMPFAFPPPTDANREIAPIEYAPRLLTVGVVSEVKGLAVLIAAAGVLAEARPGVTLTIAGPGEPEELERWRALAREIAPGVAVEVTGHVSESRYRELLRDTDIAVQLRTLSNGEASAAIADCLAAGLPTVVTDLGWARELPAGVVAPVAHDITPPALAARLDELAGSPAERRSLHERARLHAGANGFERVARAYLRELDLL
jgi:glycosyltransferase involved in cell wall biosynthesis